MASFDARVLVHSLIGGMEIEEFNRVIREKRAEKFEAAIGLEQLDQLYSLSRLESLFKWEALPAIYVDVFDHGNLRKLADVQRKSGKSSLAVVADNFRQGSTIRVRDADKFDARLDRFASEIQRYFTAQSQINIYLTPPAKTGFPPHFDTTDVFVVQCLGQKEWKIFHDYSDKRDLPLLDTIWDPDRFKPSAHAEAITLRPGDVLYLPRGVMHEASCTKRESMHLTISIVPLTFADIIAKALKLAAEADIAYRRRVPWSIEKKDGGSEELSVQVRELTIRLANQIDLGALLRAECGSFEGKPEEHSSGKLESAIATLIEDAGSELSSAFRTS